MEKRMAESSDKLVVLEIGCGVRVPSVRQECQDVIMDTATRCQSTGTTSMEARCTHIRINPEDYEIQDLPVDNMTTMIVSISIQGAALPTLLSIDKQREELSKVK